MLMASAATAVAGCPSIEAFGGSGDGSTDNLAAWNSAVSSFGSGDICIEFGAGTYLFSSTAAATPAKNISIIGTGKSTTHLLWNANVFGMALNTGNQMTVTVSGIDFISGSLNTHNALSVNSSDCTGSKQSSNFRDLSFEGSGSYPFTNYWAYGLVLNTLSFVNISNVDFWGDSANHMIGLVYESANAPSCYALILNVDKAQFIGAAIGFVYGTYAQGVTITQSNFTNGLVGISLPSSSISPAQLVVSDSQFNTAHDQISIQGILMGGQFHHNTFTVPPTSYTGLHIYAGFWYVVDGNNFLNGSTKGLTGVQVDSNNAGNAGVITGNTFSNLSYGVSLSAGSDHWNVQSNMYASTVGTKTVNFGTNNILGGGSP